MFTKQFRQFRKTQKFRHLFQYLNIIMNERRQIRSWLLLKHFKTFKLYPLDMNVFPAFRSMFELRDIYSLYQFIHGKQQASEKKNKKMPKNVHLSWTFFSNAKKTLNTIQTISFCWCHYVRISSFFAYNMVFCRLSKNANWKKNRLHTANCNRRKRRVANFLLDWRKTRKQNVHVCHWHFYPNVVRLGCRVK